MQNSTKVVKEFDVSVPWGKVAGKAWGNEKNPPVLVVHGRLDNAGSFDHLIPLLPDSFYYICIDLPGHGLSSHFPPHLPIFSVNFIPVYKIVMDYFKREKYIIIGHSYGGQIGFFFAQLYPQYVEKLILLDSIHFFPTPARNFRDYFLDVIETHLDIERKLAKGEKPSYTYEEALSRLLQGRPRNNLELKAAEALIQRSIAPTGDGKYSFMVDQRMKNFISPLHDFRYAIESIKHDPVTCPVLILLANDSLDQQMFMEPILKVLRKRKNVRIKHVDGDHDVHNNKPENIVPYITKFLLEKKSKL